MIAVVRVRGTVAQMTPPTVNADNFARAETHRMFSDLQRDAGGINRFLHNREPASVEKQTVIRMNRDTLYSIAIVDISAESVIVEAHGTEAEIDALVALLGSYGIKELVRTGATVMLRGASSIEEAILGRMASGSSASDLGGQDAGRR